MNLHDQYYRRLFNSPLIVRALFEGIQSASNALSVAGGRLTRKFGILPKNVQQRIRQADTQQLETWSLNILTANTLDQVFDT